jgi:hypothetical protein
MSWLKTTQRTPLKSISIFKLSIAVMLTSGIFASSLGWSKSSKGIHEFIVPFEMKYYTKVSGMDINLTQRLEQPINGQYKENIIAKGALGKVTEEGLFHISKQGRVIPDKFSKNQKTILGKRFEFQEYDWQAKKLNFSFKKRTGSLNLQQDYQDTMTHKQQLRFDLASGLTDIYYTVIKNGQVENYLYQVVGHEVLETSIGELNTTILTRTDVIDGEKSADAQSKIWLASDWDYLMLKLETIDKDSVKIMTFTQGTLDGRPITPLEAKTET